jgi:hypothetical protein
VGEHNWDGTRKHRVDDLDTGVVTSSELKRDSYLRYGRGSIIKEAALQKE